MKRPLCVELFAGTFGWSAGWHEMGGRTLGFDIEHLSHHGPVPTGDDLVLQDVLTLNGRKLKGASLILCSPPCQEFSYMAMPWTRAKQIAAALRGQGEFPPKYYGSRTVAQLTALFDACFRIQREASNAAGRRIPMVVENVRGAQPWVGRSQWQHGSYALWGDVPALMPIGKAVKLGTWEWDCKDSAQAKIRRLDEWFSGSETSIARHGSKSSARKAASALIARIPLPLSRHIAQVYFPKEGRP